MEVEPPGGGLPLSQEQSRNWLVGLRFSESFIPTGRWPSGTGLMGQISVLLGEGSESARPSCRRGRQYKTGGQRGVWSQTVVNSLWLVTSPWVLTTSSEKGGRGPESGTLIFLAVTLQDVCPEPSV